MHLPFRSGRLECRRSEPPGRLGGHEEDSWTLKTKQPGQLGGHEEDSWTLRRSSQVSLEAMKRTVGLS